MTMGSSRFCRSITKRVIVYLLVVGILAPASAAAASTRLEGTLLFADVVLAGRTHLSSNSLSALSLFPSIDGGEEGVWTLRGRSLLVNWSRVDGTSVGWVPNSNDALLGTGDPSSGEKWYTNAEVAFDVWSQDANVLLAGGKDRQRFTGTFAEPVTGRPSPGETWIGGKNARNETDWRADLLHAVQNISAGTPRLEADGFVGPVQVDGTFTFYVWGTIVNVTAPDGRLDSYRSGSWDSNVTGGELHPRGVIRNGHSQLLRLEVKEGSLVLKKWVGKARIAADSVTAETTGTASLHGATGYLESKKFFYRANGESFELYGSFSLDMRGNAGSAELMAATLRGEAMETTLPPSGPVTAGPAERPTGLARLETQPQAGEFQVATPTLTWNELLLWSAAGLTVALVGWVVRARRVAGRVTAGGTPTAGKPEPGDAVIQAEEALIRGEPAAALALVKGVLERDPRNVHGWFVHGASLIRQQSFRQAVKDLEPVARRASRDQPGLAFLLCLSYLGLGKVAKARRWAKIASADPDFRRQIDMDEAFAAVRQRPSSPTAPAPVFAERPAPDPAYG